MATEYRFAFFLQSVQTFSKIKGIENKGLYFNKPAHLLFQQNPQHAIHPCLEDSHWERGHTHDLIRQLKRPFHQFVVRNHFVNKPKARCLMSAYTPARKE